MRPGNFFPHSPGLPRHPGPGSASHALPRRASPPPTPLRAKARSHWLPARGRGTGRFPDDCLASERLTYNCAIRTEVKRTLEGESRTNVPRTDSLPPGLPDAPPMALLKAPAGRTDQAVTLPKAQPPFPPALPLALTGLQRKPTAESDVPSLPEPPDDCTGPDHDESALKQWTPQLRHQN